MRKPMLCGVLMLGLAVVAPALARDSGQWDGADPAIAAWYATLMQPDHPSVSCCGEGDGYWADTVETADDGGLVAIITDDRPDEPLKRRHVPIGTRIPIPPHKIKWNSGNPTGHIVIFLNYLNQPLCYVQNGGV